jgi:hypothetical protein
VTRNGETDINQKLRYCEINVGRKAYLKKMQIFARNGNLVQGDP